MASHLALNGLRGRQQAAEAACCWCSKKRSNRGGGTRRAPRFAASRSRAREDVRRGSRGAVRLTAAKEEETLVEEKTYQNQSEQAESEAPNQENATPEGLRGVRNIVAVSSCKGGVGKSTTCVNLAFSLRQAGAKVGIFDADVYGPSLPIMVSPEYSKSKLEMDPVTKEITPVEYEDVKMVSFGFTTEGSAMMRGPMASGLVNQLLTTTNWGELDYLLIDMPPGTGDIHLTIGQAVPITCAVIVTTPHKLAYVDVAKGIRMFARLNVPCVSVVENMSYFDGDDGKRYFPFGTGSGERIVREFAIPNLFLLPIREEVSNGSDTGVPCVLQDPESEISQTMGNLAGSVVQEVGKMKREGKNKVAYDPNMHEMHCKLLKEDQGEGSDDGEDAWETFEIEPKVVRKNDQSAKFIDQLTGKPIDPEFNEHIFPLEIKPLGNYAVQISWSDGFNQIATYDQLRTMERL